MNILPVHLNIKHAFLVFDSVRLCFDFFGDSAEEILGLVGLEESLGLGSEDLAGLDEAEDDLPFADPERL